MCCLEVQLQGQVRHGQLDRDSEQADHAAMLREIQKLLAEERAQKDHFESQVDVLLLFIVVVLCPCWMNTQMMKGFVCCCVFVDLFLVYCYENLGSFEVA